MVTVLLLLVLAGLVLPNYEIVCQWLANRRQRIENEKEWERRRKIQSSLIGLRKTSAGMTQKEQLEAVEKIHAANPRY